MVDDLEEIRQSLSVDKIYILSHSFGGIIAVNYAKKYPKHLSGLILANATLDLNNSILKQIKHINGLIGTNYAVTDKDSILSTYSKARHELSSKGLDYKMLSDNKKAVDILDNIDKSYKRTDYFARHFWDYIEYRSDFTNDTKYIDVPVLIITGKKDYAIGVNHYRLFKFPNKKEVKIDGGHILYYEQNNEFISVIFSFINK